MVFWFGIEMGIKLGKVMVTPTEVWIRSNDGLGWTETGGLIILENMERWNEEAQSGMIKYRH